MASATLDSIGVRLTVIRRDGRDGATISGAAMRPRACLFGRADDVDVKILLPPVAPHQCRLLKDDNDAVFLEPIASNGSTFLNGNVLTQRLPVRHGDIIGISDRMVRVSLEGCRTCRAYASYGRWRAL